ncbi:MAG: sulfotransferase domain-containing protein [Candidatus Sulfotelmatobacter sp.]
MSTLIRIRARASRTSFRAPLVWARHLGLDSSDVFLASYPRSGNTLLRFPLAEAVSGAPCSFQNVQRIVPEIGVHVDAYPLLPSGGRLIKTHERYRRKYRRAIYVVRDVRDVLLSAFSREAAMDLVDPAALDDYIEPFMQGRMSRWGAWQNHIEEWLGSPLARSGNLLVMRFEDVSKDIEGSVARALGFLSLPADQAAIRRACTNNSIDKMRAKEDQSSTLPKTGAQAGRLINSGSIYGWRQRLSRPQVALIEQYAGKVLSRLGYETSRFREATKRKRPGQEFAVLESTLQKTIDK